MTIQWTPLRDYSSYEHVLGAGACFCHPGNGNVYYWACEKEGGTHQNLTIYRHIAKTGVWEQACVFLGTVDAVSFIERGGCVIDHTGALIVATSLDPKDGKTITGTGFEGVRTKIEGVDEPWLLQTELIERLAFLESRLNSLIPTPGTLRLAAQNAPNDGGEIQLSDGAGGVWVVDVRLGRLRIFRQEAGKPAREVMVLV